MSPEDKFKLRAMEVNLFQAFRYWRVEEVTVLIERNIYFSMLPIICKQATEDGVKYVENFKVKSYWDGRCIF